LNRRVPRAGRNGQCALADIRQNLEKISYHGKRADAIVKGCFSTRVPARDKRKILISIP
jgi:hypothetical protein